MTYKNRKKVHKKSNPMFFDKYDYYLKSVQSPENDVEFLSKVYKDLNGRKAKTLREDFCGTFALSLEWVKLASQNSSYCVDLDPEPLTYGKEKYLKKLTHDQQKRIHIFEKNVLEPNLNKVDISVAMNFSYFLFKERTLLKQYFINCLKSLNKNGLLIIDLFGGSLCQEQNEEVTKLKNFNYYWEQANFDPIRNGAVFHIHYKPKGHKKIEKVFSYDWRMWSLPELRELLQEVGFKKTHVYWEGTSPKGEGNGKFSRTEKGEECQSWIAYIVAQV